MGDFCINDCGKHVYCFMDGEWVDITEIKDACFRLAEEEEEIPDDDIPFCDRDCTGCCDCDQLDEYEIVDEDEIDIDLYEGEELFWGIPDVRRIIFNDPATIVFWEDDTKTVVKCMAGEKFERYAGFAAACMKKMFGSTSRAKAVMEESDTENMQYLEEDNDGTPET